MADPAKGPFTEAEKAAFRFAERMTLEHREIDAKEIAELRTHWNEAEIVEMACVIGIFNYLNRFAEALGLNPTQPGEGGPDDAG
jgi:alkylhydroperoxidase family enzyme